MDGDAVYDIALYVGIQWGRAVWGYHMVRLRCMGYTDTKVGTKKRGRKAMQNINYDLLKLLHAKLDTVWRLEKHYMEDADKAACHSIGELRQMLVDDKKHIAALNEEIRMRMQAGKWN